MEKFLFNNGYEKTHFTKLLIKNNFLVLVTMLFCSCTSPNSTNQVFLSHNENSSKNIVESIKLTNDALKSNKDLVKVEKVENSNIFSGYGTDKVHLGVNREYLLNVLGQPTEEYTHKIENCSYSEMHWLNISNNGRVEEGDGIFCYLKDDAVFRISFSGNKYSTAENFKLYSPLNEVMSKNPMKTIYSLTNSGNGANNNKDLSYLINQENGIAFEFAYGFITKERLVRRIYVFSPEANFLPNICGNNNQVLIPLEATQLNSSLIKIKNAPPQMLRRRLH